MCTRRAASYAEPTADGKKNKKNIGSISAPRGQNMTQNLFNVLNPKHFRMVLHCKSTQVL